MLNVKVLSGPCVVVVFHVFFYLYIYFMCCEVTYYS